MPEPVPHGKVIKKSPSSHPALKKSVEQAVTETHEAVARANQAIARTRKALQKAEELFQRMGARRERDAERQPSRFHFSHPKYQEPSPTLETVPSSDPSPLTKETE